MLYSIPHFELIFTIVFLTCYFSYLIWHLCLSEKIRTKIAVFLRRYPF